MTQEKKSTSTNLPLQTAQALNEGPILFASGFIKLNRKTFFTLCHYCTPKELMIYIALLSHRNSKDNSCYPSMHLLTEECNLTRQSVSKALEELIHKKFIAVKRDERLKRTCYTFLLEDYLDSLIEDPASQNSLSDEEVIDHYAATLEDPPKPPRSKSSGRPKKKAEQEARPKAEQSPKPPKPPKGPITIVTSPEEDPDYDILNDDSFDF